jgi:hypothetical protein
MDEQQGENLEEEETETEAENVDLNRVAKISPAAQEESK